MRRPSLPTVTSQIPHDLRRFVDRVREAVLAISDQVPEGAEGRLRQLAREVDSAADHALAGHRLVPALERYIDTVLQESRLYRALNQQMEVLSGPADVIGSAASQVAEEALARAEALIQEELARLAGDQALDESITTLVGRVDDSEAALVEINNVSVDSTSASALALVSLQATIEDPATGLTSKASSESVVATVADLKEASVTEFTQINAAFQSADSAIVGKASITDVNAVLADGTSQTAQHVKQLAVEAVDGDSGTILEIEGKVDHLGGLYAVRIDQNGAISGYGLASTAGEAGDVVTDFYVRADTFAVYSPDGESYSPFQVLTTGNPEGKPPGVYIDAANIINLTVETANLGLTAADIIGLGDLATADSITTSQVSGLGTLATQSSVTTSQVSGLGTLATQSSVTTGQVTGLGDLATEDTVSTSQVTGLGDLATEDTVSTSQVTGLGDLATEDTVRLGTQVRFPDGSVIGANDLVSRLSKITSSNISTFIGSAAIGSAYIGNITADKITTGSLSVSTELKSSNYSSTNGWLIDGNGNVVFNQGTFRGITVRDSSGNIILSSGRVQVSGVDGLGDLATEDSVAYSALTGTRPPTDADKTSANTAAGIANQGDLATLDQVTSTYIANAAITEAKIANLAVSEAKIENAAITEAKIANLAVSEAKIENAAVDTLKIADNAVTVPASYFSSASVTGSGVTSWKMVGYVQVSNLGNYDSLPVHISFSVRQAYASGLRTSGFVMTRRTYYSSTFSGGTLVREFGTADAVNDFPSGTAEDTVSPLAKWYFYLFWAGEDSSVSCSGRSLLALGVKR